MDRTIRIAGEAGQGVQTTGSLLAGSLAALGMHVLASQSYMSRIRGGVNWLDLRIGDAPLFGPREAADLLVALRPAALEVLGGGLHPGGLALVDGEGSAEAAGVPLTKTAKEVGGSAVMANTVAAGAVYAILGYPVEELCAFLSRQFAKKGPEVIAANVACAQAGAALVAAQRGALPGPAPHGASPHLLMGAEAVGLGAATAGVRFAAAYPMSPSTATFTYLASVADRYGIVVEQAEDEIAAANMACGATYAGVPALTTTSGGGFALMAEAVSLAGMMELPLVILLAQRPGPATGLPTRTAQGDLLFALHAGHGEFPRALFAPGTVQECYAITRQALTIAHRYQTPAIILTDQFLQDLTVNGEPLDPASRPIDRGIVLDPPADYVRYAVTESGVSPRAVPGGAARVVVDSDAHDATGHLAEDLGLHLEQHDKRMRKCAGLAEEALPPTRYGPAHASRLLVCWGSTYGPCREAVELLNAGGDQYAMLHFSQVWPVSLSELADALALGHDLYIVEGNSTGQFATLLREAGLLHHPTLVLRYDGLPFTAEYIAAQVLEG